MQLYDILKLIGWISLLGTLVTSLIIKSIVKKIDNNKPFNVTRWSKILLAMIIVSFVLVIFSSVFEILTVLSN